MATRFLVIDGKIAKDTRTGMPIALTDNIFTNVTYEVLKTMRDNGHLLSGEQYRIVDFVTTTSQGNTQSAGHHFDLIVTADSANTLNENARAVAHEGDTYFANCKLSAWEIKYSLDNDTTRFAWARVYTPATAAWFTSGYDSGVWYATGETYEHDGVTYYVFHNEVAYSTFYSAVPAPTASNSNEVYIDFEGSGTLEDDGSPIDNCGDGREVPEGKGVIYYMKDEYGNECPYDFKNIQYYREGTYHYTFSWVDENGAVKDMSIVGNTTTSNDEGQIARCYDNKMGIVSLYAFDGYNNPNNSATALNNNVFISTYGYEGSKYKGCYQNTFGGNCYQNTFGGNCYQNTFGNDCYYNTFGNDCAQNTFGNDCRRNTFGGNCYQNTFGNDCYQNTFGNDCYCNTFGNYCGNNTFGNYCGNNIVDNGTVGAKPQPTTGTLTMTGVHIHFGVTGQFTVARGAYYTQDVRNTDDVTITV